MGILQSKKRRNACEEDLRTLRERTSLLRGQMNEIICTREKERRAYEREVMVFSLKEAEWKRERKKLKEEVKRLRKRVEEREDMEDGAKVGIDWGFLVEHIMEERERRDEAVEKWKKLYLAIKTELDDLIQRTHSGERLNGSQEEEDLIEELREELKVKEETIEVLKAGLAEAKQEETKKEREVDILRQSLRIMSNKKKAMHVSRGQSIHC